MIFLYVNLITVYITYYEMIYYFKGEEEKRIYYSNFKLFYLLILYKLFCQRCFQIENEIFTSLIDRLLLKLWIFSKFFFKVSLSRRLTDLRISIHLFFTSLKNQLKTSTPLFIVRSQNNRLWLFEGDKRIWNDLYGGWTELKRKERRWQVEFGTRAKSWRGKERRWIDKRI